MLQKWGQFMFSPAFSNKKAALKPDYLWFSRGEKEDKICNYSLFVFCIFFETKRKANVHIGCLQLYHFVS